MELPEIMKKLKDMEGLKNQAIEKLLQQRDEINAQLATLGHGDAPKVGKKRTRRTKDQILADKAKEAKG